MRVFLAGATGAVGRSLVPLLVQAGHEVTGSTRSESKLAGLRAAGAEGVLMDGLDAAGVLAAVRAARPDVIVHQQSALIAQTGNPKRFDRDFATTNRLRIEGTDHLLAAARETGVTRFVAQSYTGWTNARSGGPVKTEDDPFEPNPESDCRETMRGIQHVERVTTGTPGIDGLALRYGNFYGRGTGMTGTIAEVLRKRKLPIVGGGTAVWSVVHIDDAARATLAAIEGGAPAVYNIVDDDPAPAGDMLTTLAAAVGAKPPRRLPTWLARPLIGDFGIAFMTTLRGSSNAKAKRELGWKPDHASWRQGFYER
ncbi:NAD-dependent epimerase/dehydratase family protein [Jiangella alkaliphila]|uniref:Nucleoside-diphosphate-sugar epimerase n=1 Tax=Jiangella alkaliphila TaxID=419479 RepID=A0A1H2ID00_9ACTN|nr:NAD(P)-dependent oxidoreductase [Jiangella alkaliphila]SDU41816.1 Nucleoside-diphosphate-sugar epimerase [Jiangella alkaliphila]